MSMHPGLSRAIHAAPNVTPLIDVLLVLLIIFMVIVPAAPKGLDAVLPQPPRTTRPAPSSTILVQILAGTSGPTYKINNETVAGKAALAAELHRIYSIRAERVLFLEADPQLDFAAVADVLDLSRALGIDRVALLTPHLRAG